MKEFSYVTSVRDKNLTVGQILKKLGFSEKEISRQKFVSGGIQLDDRQCRVTEKIREGQTLKLLFPEKKQIAGDAEGLKADEIPEILYEDDDLIVVNKPEGLSSHQGRGHYQDNLGTRLQLWMVSQGISASAVREIGRLDRDTSGLMVFAKNRISAARLSRQRQEGKLEKLYYALVWGSFVTERGVIDLPIGAVPGEKNKMEVSELGKKAVTCYRVIKSGAFRGREVSLLECRLKTGRTHQIRVHMAASGYSLVGDPLYGNDQEDKGVRLCLHAGSIRFLQPFTGKEICVTVRPDSWPLNWEEETWQNG
ncbi:MAG: RluA family pseudouridine synthase [Blautia sp.]|nr:RluA family pseudouridine synthase [Blautia sp.]